MFLFIFELPVEAQASLMLYVFMRLGKLAGLVVRGVAFGVGQSDMM